MCLMFFFLSPPPQPPAHHLPHCLIWWSDMWLRVSMSSSRDSGARLIRKHRGLASPPAAQHYKARQITYYFQDLYEALSHEFSRTIPKWRGIIAKHCIKISSLPSPLLFHFPSKMNLCPVRLKHNIKDLMLFEQQPPAPHNPPSHSQPPPPTPFPPPTSSLSGPPPWENALLCRQCRSLLSCPYKADRLLSFNLGEEIAVTFVFKQGRQVFRRHTRLKTHWKWKQFQQIYRKDITGFIGLLKLLIKNTVSFTYVSRILKCTRWSYFLAFAYIIIKHIVKCLNYIKV